MLIAGLALVAVGAVIPGLPSSTFQQSPMAGGGLSTISQSFLGAGGIALGGILVALGIVSFVVAYGLLKGRQWAWTISIILSAISIVLNAISIISGNFGGIVSIIISGIIIYYLYRPHVKAYFGKGATTPSSAEAA